ncbi:unnamed protein product [Euphydryas editha]|uniref:Uncharacterized protein n=1 Tax=Euphydryas editha TaxID=104508 RepID=A0AAU9THJ0_EUPED|nr:unnamed protein product [Euphydryas editha]
MKCGLVKITILLGTLALAKAGSSATYFTPETSLSSVYTLVHRAPNNKAPVTPAPIYEEDLSSKEIGSNSGGQNTLKSHNIIYPALPNYYTHITDLTHPTIYDHSVNAPHAYNPYTFSSPFNTNRISTPVTYTTHTHSTPFETRTHISQLKTKTSDLTYNSHTPIEQNEAIKSTITYAEAPEVSHTTFTGHGTTYSW